MRRPQGTVPDRRPLPVIPRLRGEVDARVGEASCQLAGAQVPVGERDGREVGLLIHQGAEAVDVRPHLLYVHGVMPRRDVVRLAVRDRDHVDQAFASSWKIHRLRERVGELAPPVVSALGRPLRLSITRRLQVSISFYLIGAYLGLAVAGRDVRVVAVALKAAHLALRVSSRHRLGARSEGLHQGLPQLSSRVLYTEPIPLRGVSLDVGGAVLCPKGVAPELLELGHGGIFLAPRFLRCGWSSGDPLWSQGEGPSFILALFIKACGFLQWST